MIFALEACRARSLQYGRAPPRAIKATLTAANAGLDSAGSPPAVSTAPRVALARCSFFSLWGCFLCCLLLSAPVLFPSGSSSVGPGSAPLSSAAPRPVPVLPASCGGSAPPVLGGASTLRGFGSVCRFAGLGRLRCRALGSVGSPLVRASSPSSCPAAAFVPVSSLRSVFRVRLLPPFVPRVRRGLADFFFARGAGGHFLGGGARCVPLRASTSVIG